MANNGKQTFGEYLFSSIGDNEYLREIRADMLSAYCDRLFGRMDTSEPGYNIDDALAFIDLLSKSTGTSLSEQHKARAQEMASVLAELLPDNRAVAYSRVSALAASGNYAGMPNDSKFMPASVFDYAALEIDRDYFRMPFDGVDAGTFLPKQKAIYDGFTERAFSFSAPTSMGKSMMMRLFAKEVVSSGSKRNVAILLPTKALINEVSGKVIDSLSDLLEANNYRVVTSVSSLALEGDHGFVFVVTPERMLFILNQHRNIAVDTLFVDEAHKLSSPDRRSLYYHKVISKVRERNTNASIVFASPNIPNPEVYLKLATNRESSPVQKEPRTVETEYSPVTQIKLIADLQERDARVFDELSKTLIDVDCATVPTTLNELITLVGNETMNIVYCKSKCDALRFALDYAKAQPRTKNEELLKFAHEVREDIHDQYYLADLLEKGIAYHVGYLPSNIRIALEDHYKEGRIRIVFCTSTLLEGVNLPAKNLFITSTKKGRAKLSEVDFKNLAGRVGRIGYEQIGNVIAVVLQSANCAEERARFESLISGQIPRQVLSTESGIKPSVKEHIAETLKEGKRSISKASDSQTEREFEFMRMASMTLLGDIIENRQSELRREFDEQLTPDVVEKISSNYPDARSSIVDDLSISLDQADGLVELVSTGIAYPALASSGKGADYDELYEFLTKLADAFRWDLYEKGTLGYKQNGEYTKLRHYAALLNSWVSGHGLSYIIKSAIWGYDQNNRMVYFSDGHSEPFDGSRAQINEIIGEILADINDVLLFRLSNYFLKFSEEFERQHPGTRLENDWYEYVEHGSTDKLRIFLQRLGYSRQATEYIKDHSTDLLDMRKDEIYLKKDALLNSSSGLVANETETIRYNFPDCFTNG